MAKTQGDSLNSSNHSIYFSHEHFIYRDVQSVYGYQFSTTKSDISIGVCIGRKRLPYLFIPYYYNFDDVSFHYRFYGQSYLIDTNFSVSLNGITLGYAYHFKRENKLHAYPFVNLYFLRYQSSGIFEGEIEPGVFGVDNFEAKRFTAVSNFGWGFEYKFHSRFSAKVEFGLGLTYYTIESDSDYYGHHKTFQNNYYQWNGFGRLGIYYHFGK